MAPGEPILAFICFKSASRGDGDCSNSSTIKRCLVKFLKKRNFSEKPTNES